MIAVASWLYRSVPVDEIAPTEKYDAHFRKYNKRYFSVLFDWRWFKAQSMAESGLRRNVLSNRGAIGLMQIMPDTFNEIVEPYPHLFNIADPKWNVGAGIAFNRSLYDRWNSWVPPEQSLKFTFSSYNAGLRRMLRVKKRAAAEGLDSDLWSSVAPFAPDQTRHYVKRIHGLMGRKTK